MASAGGTGRWAHRGRPEVIETRNRALNGNVTGSTSNKRESYSIPLTATPTAPCGNALPEKGGTHLSRAPESRNVNTNGLTKTALGEHGTPPGPAGPEHNCSPPVMEATSSVLGSDPLWPVPPGPEKRGLPGWRLRGF